MNHLLIAGWIGLMLLWLIAAPLAWYLEYDRTPQPRHASRPTRDLVLAMLVVVWDRLTFRRRVNPRYRTHMEGL